MLYEGTGQVRGAEGPDVGPFGPRLVAVEFVPSPLWGISHSSPSNQGRHPAGRGASPLTSHLLIAHSVRQQTEQLLR